MRPFSRANFDAVLAHVFPNITVHRKETTFGWTDTAELGWIQLEFTAYTTAPKTVTAGRRKPGELDIRVLGVRPSTGNSIHLLQKWTVVGLHAFKKCLIDEVSPKLLGLSAALLHICGQDTGIPPHFGPPKKAQNGVDLTLDDVFGLDDEPEAPENGPFS